MFGYSLIRKKKLMAIYEKMAIFALEKVRQQKHQYMVFSGLIQTAMPEQSGTTAAGKQWRRKDFIMLYDNSNAQYPKTVLFSVMGENIDKLNIQQGVEYDVQIDFSTREYNGRTYMSATAWKAEAKGQSAQPTQAAYPPAQPQVQTAAQSADDLPF